MNLQEIINLLLALVLLATNVLTLFLTLHRIAKSEGKGELRHTHLVQVMRGSYRQANAKVLRSLREVRSTLHELSSSGQSSTSNVSTPVAATPSGSGPNEGCDDH